MRIERVVAGLRRCRPAARAAGPRIVAYGVIAGLAAVAASRNPPPVALVAPFALTPTEPRATDPFFQPLPTLAPLDAQPPQPGLDRVDTLRSGETLAQVLARGGLPDTVSAEVVRAAGSATRRLRMGMPVFLRRALDDSLPTEIVLHVTPDVQLRITRAPSGWRAEEVPVAWHTDTVVVSGEIESTLSEALAADNGAGLPSRARAELAWSLADIFEYRVDMSRDLQQGDSVRALVVRSSAPDGRTRVGNVLAARLELSGTELEAIRYEAAGARPEYFDRDGKSLRLAFLRTPLAFRRVSSAFGMRRHPILGIWRQHTGTDYAAAAGTPIRVVGDGIVVYAGRRGGYGIIVEVRHRNGFVSRYGHMRAIARGVGIGSRVAIGETIGFVGMTGLATAPHLHFEVLVGGVQRDPRAALALKHGLPVPAGERPRFESVRTALLAALDRRPPASVALRAE